VTTRDDAADLDRLGARLSAMRFPESAGLATRAIDRYRGRARPPLRPRPALVMVGLAAALLASVATFVVSPSARVTVVTALADTPAVGPFASRLISLAGLQGAAGRVTTERVSATSHGHTVTLVGAYADNTRTVVLLHSEPGLLPELPDLTDAAGRHPGVPMASGSGNSQGDLALSFGPLVNPGAGANHLVLRIHELRTIGPPTGPSRVISGDWTLRFSVTVDRGTAVTPSVTGSLGKVDVRLTMSAAGHRAHCLVLLSGPTGDLADLSYRAGDVRVRLVGSDGRVVAENGLGAGGVYTKQGSERAEGIYVSDLTTPGPGTYHLVIAWRDSTIEQTVTLR
jgi:hypothetical protein